ncbi:hypothetical protein [Streptomyces showdoensis]|uniref:Uncharacterized protein n=1 Tax=Streptomyces showdoensis TaxID=68268 RepID=A0A2P2GTR1_STREW|nr:hypothetical protein [Streptomyces showdoensis]KKZ74873.1 hypothetical protein VO63_05340 [Streptomyces showdoensis]
MTDIPATYLGVDVPPHIRDSWHTWEGARWRTQRHWANNKPFPPDQRFTVRPPAGMCPTHRQGWLDYRNMRFNEETGDPWPGNPQSPFLFVGSDMNRLRNERRLQWDRKASEQMQLIERICLRGDSPQCTSPVEIPAPRPIVDVHLPAA